MARATFCVTKGTTTGVDDFHFTNSGGIADIQTSAASLSTDITSTGTNVTTVQTDITTALGLANATHDSTPELTTINNAASVVATNVATIQVEVDAIKNGANHDVVVSINTGVITSVTLLRKALDHVVQLARGGVGGLTLS